VRDEERGLFATGKWLGVIPRQGGREERDQFGWGNSLKKTLGARGESVRRLRGCISAKEGIRGRTAGTRKKRLLNSK